jgi:hypothetical protein
MGRFLIVICSVLSDQQTRAPDKKKDLLLFSLFLILFLIMFREFFFTGRVFFERDVTVVELPARKLTVSLLKEGNFALWTDAYGNGQPFLANPKNAVLYPATLLYFIFPLFTAFKLYYFIHVLLGWLGLYYLCKSYAISEKAAFLGSCLFAFSGMYLSSFEFYNHIAALAWMPWILLLLNREPWSERSKLIPLSIFWALLILAGSPEVILFTALLAVAQSFLKPGEWRKRIVAAALSFGLACLLTAAQLVPSFEMLAQTGRKSQSVYWPLELLQLPNMAFSNVLGNDREPGHHDYWGWHLFDKHIPLYYSLYTGFGALLLFLFGLWRPWDRRRKVLASAGTVFFLLACGRYSPFFFLYKITPFVSSIRYPVKFFLGSVFCLSILAAIGFDGVVSGRSPGKRVLRSLAIAAGLALTLFLMFRGRILTLVNTLLIIDKESSLHELGRSIVTGLILLAVYAAIFVPLSMAKSRGVAISWALVALVVLDPAFHNRGINPTVPSSFFDRPPIMGDLKSPLNIYRTDDFFLDRREKSGSNEKFLNYYRGSLFPYTAMGEGIRYVFNEDFYGVQPAQYSNLMHDIRGLPVKDQLKVLRYLGCHYYVGDIPFAVKEGPRRLTVEGFPVIIETLTNKPVTPYVVYSASHAAAQEDRLKIFVGASFDPSKEIVVPGNIMLGGPTVGAVDSDTITSMVLVMKQVQGLGRYSVNSPREGVAVFPGNYARGWRARIDGKKAAVFEANLFSRGVLVPAGNHEIVLRYLPGSIILGVAISLAAVVLLLVGFAVARVRVRKRVRPASS